MGHVSNRPEEIIIRKKIFHTLLMININRIFLSSIKINSFTKILNIYKLVNLYKLFRFCVDTYIIEKKGVKS